MVFVATFTIIFSAFHRNMTISRNNANQAQRAIMLTALACTNELSLLMDTPTGAVSIVGMRLCSSITQVTQKRMADGLFTATSIFLLSGCLLAFYASYHAQLAGYYLYTASPAVLCVISCIQSNCAGHTKKRNFANRVLFG